MPQGRISRSAFGTHDSSLAVPLCTARVLGLWDEAEVVRTTFATTFEHAFEWPQIGCYEFEFSWNLSSATPGRLDECEQHLRAVAFGAGTLTPHASGRRCRGTGLADAGFT